MIGQFRSKFSFNIRLITAAVFVVVAVALGGCAAITIQMPANNATITLPSKTTVLVTGNADYTGLNVTVDGIDFSSQMVSRGPSQDVGDFGLAAGPHTVTASAEMPCWYCAGGKTQSTDTKSFIVLSGPQICFRYGSTPVITLDPSLFTTSQTPGRQKIGYLLQNGRDALLILVDDAPGLKRTEMLVELDIDPFSGVEWNKAIEAWGFCRSGSRVGLVEASMLGGINVGTACSQLSETNNWRSGCTTTQTMMLNQSTTSELWLRKPEAFGLWNDAEAIDSSIWQAFGGRSVRFIWRSD
jgi:hypothetical protein